MRESGESSGVGVGGGKGSGDLVVVEVVGLTVATVVLVMATGGRVHDMIFSQTEHSSIKHSVNRDVLVQNIHSVGVTQCKIFSQ